MSDSGKPSPKVLMVIAPGQFRDEEYVFPREIFEEHYNIRVTVASTEPGEYTGKFGTIAKAEIALKDVNPEDYDAVAFIGGAGAQVYIDDEVAQRLAIAFFEAKRPVGAICIAPAILARAGLLNGRMATAFADRETDLREYGAIYTGQWLTVDAPFVTASGPIASHEFGHELAKRAVRHACAAAGVEPPDMPWQPEPPPPDPGAPYGEQWNGLVNPGRG